MDGIREYVTKHLEPGTFAVVGVHSSDDYYEVREKGCTKEAAIVLALKFAGENSDESVWYSAYDHHGERIYSTAKPMFASNW